MNQEAIMELVVSSQAGDAQALEQLMLCAHTPVLYLCRKLLHDEQTAQEQTREILQIIGNKLEALENPAEFESWLCRIASARCMQVLRQLRRNGVADEPFREKLSISGKTLNEEETADAIEKMVDMLPEAIRICIYLCCCGSMNSRAVAQVTGYSVDAVRANLNQGYAVLQKMLEKYEQRGTQFSGIGSVAEILRIAMYRAAEDNSAMVMVYGILGKKLPVPPQPGRWIVWILLAVVGILLAADLVLGGMLLLNRKNSVSEEFVLPTIQITEAAEETTEETTLPATQPETTEATVVQTTAATQPEETQAATKATEKEEDTTSSTTAASTGTGSKTPADAPQTGEDGHTHRYLKTSTNFNCETGGTKRYLCSDCDYYYTEDLAPTGTHSFTITPGPANMDATCTSPGKSYKLCTKCNFGMVIDDPEGKPALGHNYSSTVQPPTATEQGYTLHTCSRCGDSYKDNYVDPIAQESQTPASSSPAAGEAPPEP